MSLLSELSRGYGSWTAGYVDPYYKDSKDREPTLPEIDTESHVHGVTVSTKSGRSTAMSWATRRTREHTDDSIHIPKTFSTRRGALQLFVAPDDLEDEEEEKEEEDDGYKLRPRYMGLHRPMGQELIDLSLKLGTLERLASSVLQFGDKEAESEEENISHEKNKAFLKFLHQIDGRRARTGEHTLRPGEDLNTYLRDLRSSSSMRFHGDGSTYLPKNRESQELQAILRGLDHQGWPMAFNQDAYSDRHSSMGQFTRPVSRVSSRGASPGKILRGVGFIRPPSTPRSSYQVLSSKKLAASLKSLNYLGRPSSRLSVDDDVLSDIPQPVSAANVTLKGYSPAESVDEDLVAMRNTGFWGSTAGSTVGDDSEMDELKKRRLTRLKEKSHLTYSETLYQGRNSQKGEGQHKIEVKVDNYLEGKGHSMSQIEEENAGAKDADDGGEDEEEEDAASEMWNQKVAAAQKRASLLSEDMGFQHNSPVQQKPRPSSLKGSTTSSASTPTPKTRSSSAKSVIDQQPVKEVTFIEPEHEQTRKISIDEKPFTLKKRPSSGGSLPSRRLQPQYQVKRRMSIVTVQNLTKPQPQSDQILTFTPSINARRKSYASYDYEKTKNAILGQRRMSDAHSDNRKLAPEKIEAPSFYLSPRIPQPGSSYGKGSWASNIDAEEAMIEEGMFEENMIDEQMENDSEHDNADGSRGPLPTPVDQNYYVDMSEEHYNHMGSETGEAIDHMEESQEVDDEDQADCINEEDLLVNIQECDAEIGEIEDKYDARSVVSSSLGTYDDQQGIESVNELNYASDDIEKVDDNEQQETQEVEEILTEDTEMVDLAEELEKDVTETFEPRDDLEDGDNGEGVEEAENKGLDALQAVDEAQEEDASTTISYHSAHKAKSRHSVVSASETGSRYGGDRHSDISQSKASDSSPVPDEDDAQFTGSTDSYIDMLAQSNSDSHPVTSRAHTRENSATSKSESEATNVAKPASAKSLSKKSNHSSRSSSGKSGIGNGNNFDENINEENETSDIDANPLPMKDDLVDEASNQMHGVSLEEVQTEIETDDIKEDVEKADSLIEIDKDSYKESVADDTSVSGVEQPAISKTDQIVIKTANQVAEPEMKAEPKPEIAKPAQPERKPSLVTQEKLHQSAQEIINKVISKPRESLPKPTVKADVPVPVPQPKVEISQETETVVKDTKTIEKNAKTAEKDRKKSVPEIVQPQPEAYNPFRNQKAVQKQQRTAHLLGKDKKKPGVGSKVEAGSLDGGGGTLGEGLQGTGQEPDSHSIAAELESLGLGSGSTGKKKGKKDKVPGGMHYTPPPPGKRPKAPADKLKIPDHLKDALKRRPSLSFESLERDLERITEIVGDTLSGPTLEAVGEGLTQEELELAKIILQKKIDEARNKIDGKEIPTKKKAVPVKSAKKGGKKKKDDVKTEEELEREAIQARHAEASKKRDAEAAELQRKIAERRALLQAQGDQASAKSKEIREKMEALEREAEDLQRAEDEARDILADVRKKQREEREARRRADLERKKNEAADRRERERKEIEEKRQKEIEMMEKIADAEMRRRLREEEERKAEEEERLAQERYEEEMKENARLEEEAEERMKEMERQAEEEAMQRLIFEREEAERERRKLREEEERMREEERMKMEIMEREAERLEAEQRRIQEEEEARREMERNRLMELQRLELEARQKMQEEIEVKRQEAMSRRDFNLDNRMHVDKLRHNQGITRAWTFSYFVRWPRDTYERLMGSGDPRKTKIKNPRPKPVDAPPPMEGGPSAPEVGIPKP